MTDHQSSPDTQPEKAAVHSSRHIWCCLSRGTLSSFPGKYDRSKRGGGQDVPRIGLVLHASTNDEWIWDTMCPSMPMVSIQFFDNVLQ